MANDLQVKVPCATCGGSGKIPAEIHPRPSWEPPTYGPIPSPEPCMDCLEERTKAFFDSMPAGQRAELEAAILVIGKEQVPTVRCGACDRVLRGNHRDDCSTLEKD